MTDRYKRWVLRGLAALLLMALAATILAGVYRCPVYALLGIPCPGCGMTRALWALLRLDVRDAFSQHCLFPVALAWMGYILFGRFLSRNKRVETVLMLLSVALFAIRWILILIYT